MTFGFEDMQRDMLKDMPAQTYRNLTPQELANQAPPAPEGSDQEFWKIAATVTDPEIPVLSIADLGILRAATSDDGTPVLTITPTYSGCPAMETITADLRRAFTDAGHRQPRVELVLTPAWSTDWMSEIGKAKLEEYGIARPPAKPPRGRYTWGLPSNARTATRSTLKK